MTDRKQFEAMLEALINDDQETAKDIFHNIVVAKSREIYEELLSEDFDLEEDEDKDQDEDEDKDQDEDEDKNESYELEASDENDTDDVGGDASDDFIDDVTVDDEESDDMDGDDMDSDSGDVEDRVMDLEDALDELKAEFEELMAGDDMGGDDMGGDDMGADDMGSDMGGDDMGTDTMGGEEDELSKMMEYVNKVSLPKHGDNGANTRSTVAKANNMGGTTANIAKGGEARGEGTKGGLLNPSTQQENAGNVNVPGNAKAPKPSPVKAGHGTERKGASEQADNKKSTIGSR